MRLKRRTKDGRCDVIDDDGVVLGTYPDQSAAADALRGFKASRESTPGAIRKREEAGNARRTVDALQDGLPLRNRKWITDTLRRGKERFEKVKAKPGHDPTVLPPNSNIRKHTWDRYESWFMREGALQLSEEQIALNKARVARGEVSEEFLRQHFEWFEKPTKKKEDDVRRMLRGKKTQAMVAAKARAVNRETKTTTSVWAIAF